MTNFSMNYVLGEVKPTPEANSLENFFYGGVPSGTISHGPVITLFPSRAGSEGNPTMTVPTGASVMGPCWATVG